MATFSYKTCKQRENNQEIWDCLLDSLNKSEAIPCQINSVLLRYKNIEGGIAMPSQYYLLKVQQRGTNHKTLAWNVVWFGLDWLELGLIQLEESKSQLF